MLTDTCTTGLYALSLHDALPISLQGSRCPTIAIFRRAPSIWVRTQIDGARRKIAIDRKSTRLNSSHQIISYAVFCLKKKHVNEDPAIKDTVGLAHRDGL